MLTKEEKIEIPKLKIFTLKNFKAFRECNLSFAPLTVLIGENSSGKSSILQALLLLKQTLESSPAVGILNLDSHYVQFHQLREIIFGMSPDKAELGFMLQFENFELEFQKDEFILKSKDLEISTNFMPDELYSEYEPLKNFFRGIGYLLPIRPAPERYYPLRGIKPSWIGIKAENLADFLEANPNIKKKVQDWFVNSAKAANDVKFESDHKRGQMEILFREATTGFEIDVSRLGFGFSQMLPIVVAAYSDMNMLIFEAPEIHLNPNLHGALTDLFIEGANNSKQILVETHSEHVIYRIQRRIADGTISPEDVAIYYVRRGEEGSVAELLTLTKEGEIPGWPDGFFEAEMEDIYQRIIASS